MQDLIERLSNAIDKALAETEEGPASSSTTRELAYAAQSALTALVEHPELAAVDYGEPDPAENARVTAALIEGGSIRAGAWCQHAPHEALDRSAPRRVAAGMARAARRAPSES